jgi:hypothetical protein
MINSMSRLKESSLEKVYISKMIQKNSESKNIELLQIK